MLLPKDERRRRLLHYLRNYQALRRAVAELDEDIAGAQLPTPGTLGIAGQGRAARPAERAALRDLTRGDALRAWLAAIDAGMAALNARRGAATVQEYVRALIRRASEEA